MNIILNHPPTQTQKYSFVRTLNKISFIEITNSSHTYDGILFYHAPFMVLETRREKEPKGVVLEVQKAGRGDGESEREGRRERWRKRERADCEQEKIGRSKARNKGENVCRREN